MTEKNISKLVGLAVNDYGMIPHGGKILVGVSGGEDSVSLVLLLHRRLDRLPRAARYELVPALVDPFAGRNENQNAAVKALGEFLRDRTGLGLRVIPLNTLERLRARVRPERDTCFLCSQDRRNALIRLADAEGISRIALSHHLDDIVETALMNLFYKRELSAMIPRLQLFGGKMEIIRPLAYVTKDRISRYAGSLRPPIPVIAEDCPAKLLDRDSRRERVREIVRALSRDVPNLKNNLYASFRNPKTDYLLDRFFKPSSSGLFKRP